MQFIFYAVLCSVFVSILLKVARSYGVQLAQAIMANYVMATALTYWLLKPNIPSSLGELPWGLFTVLGILLPSIFIVMGRAVESAGIVRSDTAQRLSLFISVSVAILFLHQEVNGLKIVAIILAFIALSCLVFKPVDKVKTAYGSLYLLLVWVGYGVIDVLFKIVTQTGSKFSVVLLFAFILSTIFMIAYLIIRRTKWHLPSLFGGLLLGIFNFFNILFYIKAHMALAQNPTTVFIGMNIGVLALGTVVGAVAFKEKPSVINFVGVALGIIAVLIMAVAH